MVSSASLAAAVAVFTMAAETAQAHGYMDKPLAPFKDKKTSEWVVEIDPQWKGDWDAAKGDEGLVALYKQLKKANNVKDIRTMIDSDTKLYGEDCGFTDPKGQPQDPPTTGDATFSRGMVHAGPCEIWLDDKMVLQNDDCQSAYGDGTKATLSVFKPVDYSSCASGGCMFRFYWLALQRRDSKTYWQVYKNCIPLTGPAGGGASQSTPSTGSGSSTSQISPSSGESDSPSSGESESPSSGTSDSPSSGESDSPSSGESESPSSGESDSPSSGESESPSSGTSDSPSSGESESPSSGESESPSSGESDSPSTETTPAPESPSVDTPEVSAGKCSIRRRRH